MKKFGFAQKFLALALMAVVLMSATVVPMNVGHAFSFPWNSNSEGVAAEDDYDYWIECNTCKGSGACKSCGGTGRSSTGRMCTLCDGTGNCPHCGGVGQRKLLLIDGVEYVVCRGCLGSGICSSCDGKKYTGGGGYLGALTCYSCKGSGVCGSCKGKGYTRY